LGYNTAAFTANPWASRYFGFDVGFDQFEDFFDDTGSNSLFSEAISESSLLIEVARNVNDWLKGQNMFMSWEAFYDDIVDWASNASEPYFLWVFLVDVHVPYYAGSEYRTQSRLLLIPANIWLFLSGLHDIFAPFDGVLLEAYDNCIRHTDEFLRRLRADLTDDDPLIAIHGDHGDEFGEFGRYGHGGGLSEPLIHVPFVVNGGPNETVDRLVSLRSVPDILTDLATRQDDASGRSDEWSDSVVVSWIGQTVAVRAPRWKFVQDTSTGTHELYRIDATSGREELWESPPDALVREAERLTSAAYQERVEKRNIVDAVEEVTESSEL
jgi:arylsulfatase